MKKIRVIVVGAGNMGRSHAFAYKALDQFEIVAIVTRSKESRETLKAKLEIDCPLFTSLSDALKNVKADAVSISTYPDTHEDLCIEALKNGCHVFVEKPLATTVEGTQRIINLAKSLDKKLVVGYILRHHPSWKKFIEIAQSLGKPLVMRMNLNQQTAGAKWETHKNLMKSVSPIVDCGVHYLDVMCQMTNSRPISVSAIGARLSDEIADNMYNYGQLQVRFEDGSVGWYEAAWGPMISENAYFVKDIFGPKGSVSMGIKDSANLEKSGKLDTHTRTQMLKIHYSQRNSTGEFSKKDELIDTLNEPDHNALCILEQQFFANAILNNSDLSSHLNDALNSIKIVLAADKSVRTGKTVEL